MLAHPFDLSDRPEIGLTVDRSSVDCAGLDVDTERALQARRSAGVGTSALAAHVLPLPPALMINARRTLLAANTTWLRMTFTRWLVTNNICSPEVMMDSNILWVSTENWLLPAMRSTALHPAGDQSFFPENTLQQSAPRPNLPREMAWGYPKSWNCSNPHLAVLQA
jgi:hypothetical protein